MTNVSLLKITKYTSINGDSLFLDGVVNTTCVKSFAANFKVWHNSI